jgi:hypothetical protein
MARRPGPTVQQPPWRLAAKLRSIIPAPCLEVKQCRTPKGCCKAGAGGVIPASTGHDSPLDHGLGGGDPLLGTRAPTASRDKATVLCRDHIVDIKQNSRPGSRRGPSTQGPGTRGRPRADVCFVGCDVVLFFGNKGLSRSPAGRPSRAPVQPQGAGAPRRAPPRPGADVCFIKNEVIFFSQEQRSLSLDRTKVRLKTHPGTGPSIA